MGFVTNDLNPDDDDILIKSRTAQNRAFRGDEVAVRILDESEWDKNEKTGITRKTGEVVAILKKSIINSCAGHFIPSTSIQGETVLQFKPMDTRLPRILINKSDLTDTQIANIETNMQHNTIYQGWLPSLAIRTRSPAKRANESHSAEACSPDGKTT